MTTRNESCVFMWTDRAIFIGAPTPAGAETGVHSHPVVEVSLTLGPSIGVRCKGGAADAGPLEDCAGAVVDANVEHQLITRGPRTTVFYLDPATPDAVALSQHLEGRKARALTGDEVTEWRQGVLALLDDPGLAQAGTLFDRVVETVVGPRARAEARRAMEARALDSRITGVVELLRDNLERVMSLVELSRAVGLSEGRLRHLFREQLGIPLRRYALWLRLRRALTVAFAGEPMTAAAHAAGFSDAAHFTRTCRQMFGLAPSAFASVDLFVAEPHHPDLLAPE